MVGEFVMDVDEVITNKNEAADDDIGIGKYVIIRMIQLLCIGAFVFGSLWEGTIRFNLSTPQFLMVYGGTGAVISEIIARVFKRFEKKNHIKK